MNDSLVKARQAMVDAALALIDARFPNGNTGYGISTMIEELIVVFDEEAAEEARKEDPNGS